MTEERATVPENKKNLGRVRNLDSLISIVVPCYNEEEVIRETHSRLITELEQQKLKFEIVYVDDGSKDPTFSILTELAGNDNRVRVLSLSRNFGHQAAVTAGVDVSDGAAVVIIDADLQDPPHLIGEMVKMWEQGSDVVYGQRARREGENAFKLFTAKAFYRFLNSISDVQIPLDVGDFRLMDRAVSDVLCDMPEQDRFLRGMVPWVGFKQTPLVYERDARFAGETKYPLRKMMGLALSGILSFSMVPLRLIISIGMLFVLAASFGVVYAVANRILTDHWVSGWTMIFVSILLVGGIQLIMLGAIGEYVGRIFMATKRRPLYIIKDIQGGEDTLVKRWR